MQRVPAVAVVSSEFGRAAATQAGALGMNDACRVFVPHPIQDASDEEMQAKADAVVDDVLGALRRPDV